MWLVGCWRPRRPGRSTSSGEPASIGSRPRSRSRRTRGGDAPLLLLQAARKLEPLDVRLSRDTYLDAWGAALFAGTWRAPAAACSTSPAPRRPRPTGGSAASTRSAARRPRADLHRRAPRRGARAAACGRRVREQRGLRGGGAPVGLAGGAGGEPGCGTTTAVSRSARARVRARPRLRGARGPRRRRTTCAVRPPRVGGDFRAAALLVAEVEAVKEATGSRIGPYAAIALAGIRGREAEASELIDARHHGSHRRRPGDRRPVRALGEQQFS